MLRKKRWYLAAGLAALLLALLGGYLWRPITLDIDHRVRQIHAPAFTVGQALQAAGVSLDPDDRVEPALDQAVPLNGKIHVQRAAQVHLWENGQVRRISGLEENLTALLSQAGVVVGPSDQLLWNGQRIPNDTAVKVGAPMVLELRRARAVVIDRDGRRQKVDTAASNVAGALWDAGMRVGPGDAISAPPEADLQALEAAAGGPVTLTYHPALPLVIQAGGQQFSARSSAATVGQALSEAGLALEGLDYSIPSDDEPLPADGLIRVVRVREEITLKEELIPFESEKAPDPELEIDQVRVTRPGQMGVKVARERARFENGKEVSRGIDSDWVAAEPVAQKIGVGTKITTKTASTPDGQIEYWRALQVYATSYSPCNQGLDHCSWSTASGIRLAKGVIAVPYSWYRQMSGQRVYVSGYGFAIIGDTGGMTGRWIDLGFDEESFQTQAFTGNVTLYFLAPAPASIPYIP